jgi:hypothetical protein
MAKKLQAKPVSYKGETPESIFMKEVLTRLTEMTRETRWAKVKIIPQKSERQIDLENHPSRPSTPQLVDYENDTKRNKADHDSMITLYEENWSSGHDIYTGDKLSHETINQQASSKDYDDSFPEHEYSNYDLLLRAFEKYAEVNKS